MTYKAAVPRTGFEPARPFEHHHLKVACLPISTPGPHAVIYQLDQGQQKYFIFSKRCEKLFPYPAPNVLPV